MNIITDCDRNSFWRKKEITLKNWFLFINVNLFVILSKTSEPSLKYPAITNNLLPMHTRL